MNPHSVPLAMVLISCLLAGLGNSAPRPEDLLPPLPDEKSVPFGEPVDGIALRLIAPAGVCPGQLINLTVQAKNVSPRDRYLFDFIKQPSCQFGMIGITTPDGKSVSRSGGSGYRVLPTSFGCLKPGEIWRMDIADLGGSFFLREQFQHEGHYALTFTFTGPKLPVKERSGERVSNEPGAEVHEIIGDDATPDQLAGAWSGSVTSNTAPITLSPMTEQDLTVHEWGVFTVFNDQQYANLNRKAEWGDLPDFFYRQFPKQRLRWSPSSWDKPLIYFYSKRPCLKLNVSVKFVRGTPVVWWPATAKPYDDSGRLEPVAIPRFNALTWSAWLGSSVPNPRGEEPSATQWITPVETPLPADQWLVHARLKQAALLTVAGSKMKRTNPWETAQSESERFIFYDGLVPSPDYLHCTANDARSTTVKNSAGFPIDRLYLIDRRQPGNTQAVRTSLAVGEERKIDFAPPGDFIRQFRADLLEAGLFEAEADSLLKIWHKGFFENPGIVAIHLLPRSEYDAMLVLDVTPKPATPPTRVGIAFHPNFDAEPAITARVKEWITQLDADDFKTREEAIRHLTTAGPLARGLLEKAATTGSAEVKTSARAILESTDAGAWLK